MFDVGDGGLGDQLAMYRLADALKASAQYSREVDLEIYANRVAADNRQLVAYAERLERELRVRNEQLAASQAALTDARARLDWEISRERTLRAARAERERERERERDRAKAARSQQA